MKLNVFDERTLPKYVSSHRMLPRISMTKVGIICINRKASELLKLGIGDKVSIGQDEDDPMNWYIFKDPYNGYDVRKGYSDHGDLMFNHMALVTSLLDACGLIQRRTYCFFLAGKPTVIGRVEYWGILITENKD